MNDGCVETGRKTAHRNKHRCPINGREYSGVSARTIAHHVKNAWQWEEDDGRLYFFCEDPECEVVYFGDDDSVITKSQLRTPVGLKEKSDDSLICYCFGVSKAEARRNPDAKAFVLTQTKERLCSCETSNPSGRCCLKDFPREDMPE